MAAGDRYEPIRLYLETDDKGNAVFVRDNQDGTWFNEMTERNVDEGVLLKRRPEWFKCHCGKTPCIWCQIVASRKPVRKVVYKAVFHDGVANQYFSVQTNASSYADAQQYGKEWAKQACDNYPVVVAFVGIVEA